ncbi:hypothetical protein KIPB_013624, partial [Kipferlia bialata]
VAINATTDISRQVEGIATFGAQLQSLSAAVKVLEVAACRAVMRKPGVSQETIQECEAIIKRK